MPLHGAHLGYGRIDNLRVGAQVSPRAPQGHVHPRLHNVCAICSPLAPTQSSCAQPRSPLCCHIVGVYEVGP